MSVTFAFLLVQKHFILTMIDGKFCKHFEGLNNDIDTYDHTLLLTLVMGLGKALSLLCFCPTTVGVEQMMLLFLLRTF